MVVGWATDREGRCMQYIASDSHKRYTLASVERPTGEILHAFRDGK
jgi:hypothetical protein